jgi:hypothetical protein
MPKVGYYELREVQLNLPPETKIDCETKKHLYSEFFFLNWP